MKTLDVLAFARTNRESLSVGQGNIRWGFMSVKPCYDAGRHRIFMGDPDWPEVIHVLGESEL